MENLAEGEIREVIHGFYRAIINKDVDRMFSFCTQDITLRWASFTFKGRTEVGRWLEELYKLFTKMGIEEANLVINKNEAAHDFVIRVTTPNGRRGILPTKGSYKLKDGKLQEIQMTPSWGFLIFSREEAKKLGFEI